MLMILVLMMLLFMNLVAQLFAACSPESSLESSDDDSALRGEILLENAVAGARSKHVADDLVEHFEIAKTYDTQLYTCCKQSKTLSKI